MQITDPQYLTACEDSGQLSYQVESKLRKKAQEAAKDQD